jgi:hypothetical protein
LHNLEASKILIIKENDVRFVSFMDLSRRQSYLRRNGRRITSEPGNNPLGSLVDAIHEMHLAAAFDKIILMNADFVDPNKLLAFQVCGAVAVVPQEVMEIISD